jgi:hypothetical protein
MGARTDPELRKHIVGGHGEMVRWNEIAAPILYPEHAGPELIPLIVTGQAALRGLALLGLEGESDPDKLWPATRSHLMAMAAQVLNDPELAPARRRRRTA